MTWEHCISCGKEREFRTTAVGREVRTVCTVCGFVLYSGLMYDSQVAEQYVQEKGTSNE